MATSAKFLPGSDVGEKDIFKYPFFDDKESVKFIKNHGRIMFIVRGLPGTGKKTLTDMIKKCYDSAICCSADNYFDPLKFFDPPPRTKENLVKSHEYCHKKVQDECKKGSHPIIVSNTHVMKKEFQMYLNFAEEYEYTVIIVSTMDKFHVTPEILARSNTKGLPKSYFEKRLRHWTNVLPVGTGWFLSSRTSFYVYSQLQNALEALLNDGKFCRVFNTFDKNDLFNCYQVKTLLFCVAGYAKSFQEMKNYFKTSEVKNYYGKCFRILIQGYLVTHSDILAIVRVNDEMKPLIFEPKSSNINTNDDDDDILNAVSSFQELSVQNTYNFKTISLGGKFSDETEAVLEEECDSDQLDISKTTFIHLAERENAPFSAWKMKMLLIKSSNGVLLDGKLSSDQLSELEYGFKMCRLANNTWLVVPPKMTSFPTIFTGLYI